MWEHISGNNVQYYTSLRISSATHMCMHTHTCKHLINLEQVLEELKDKAYYLNIVLFKSKKTEA